MHKMIVAYDGSKQSEKAFKQALDIASKYSANMVVLAVAQLLEIPTEVELSMMLEDATEYFERQFRRLKDLAESLGVSTRFEVRAGHQAEQIVRIAKEEKADAIVMGHRGGGFVKKWLVGSIAKRVLSYAHCTVIIVR